LITVAPAAAALDRSVLVPFCTRFPFLATPLITCPTLFAAAFELFVTVRTITVSRITRTMCSGCVVAIAVTV
jgi:hypothetical protein